MYQTELLLSKALCASLIFSCALAALGKKAEEKIIRAADNQIRGGRIIIPPENSRMTIQDGRFLIARLTDQEPNDGVRHPTLLRRVQASAAL